MRVITRNNGNDGGVPCACSQLRRTARAVSALYDEFLGASGLTVTQYALLANLAKASGASRTALAAQMGMERTTLTRNLASLERAGLFREEIGDDKRERVLRLTSKGRAKLKRSFPLWEQAQTAFLTNFGEKRFDALQTLLGAASRAVEQARKK